MRASAPFLICLMPCLITLAPDLTVLEIEDVNTDNQREERNNFAEDFVDISRVKED